MIDRIATIIKGCANHSCFGYFANTMCSSVLSRVCGIHCKATQLQYPATTGPSSRILFHEMASAVPPSWTALHEQVTNTPPPLLLYRAFYDKCTTHFDETGINAGRADFDIAQFSDSALQSVITDHLNWKCRKPSPFVSLLSDYSNMRRWAQHMASLPFRLGRPIHIFQIDTSVACQTRFFKPKGGGRNEWLALGHIPASAIRSLATVYVDEKHEPCWLDEPLPTKVASPDPYPIRELEPVAPALKPIREPEPIALVSQPNPDRQVVVLASRPTRQLEAAASSLRPTRQPPLAAPSSRPTRQPQAVAPDLRPTRQPHATAPAPQPICRPQAVAPTPQAAHGQDTIPEDELDLPIAQAVLIMCALMIVWHLLYAIQLILEALYM